MGTTWRQEAPMPATRSTLRLFRRGSRLLVQETNLDHRDTATLRQHLERMVKVARGTLRLDLSDYWLDVRKPGGTQRCELRVTSSGDNDLSRYAGY